jgi:hypothetical protein
LEIWTRQASLDFAEVDKSSFNRSYDVSFCDNAVMPVLFPTIVILRQPTQPDGEDEEIKVLEKPFFVV